MFIRLTKNYRGFKANKILMCSALKGKYLIKNDYAEKVNRVFLIDDLYIAKIIGVKKCNFFGEIIDAVDLGYRVFIRYYDDTLFYKKDQIVYVHALTKNEFFPDNHMDKVFHNKPGEKVVYSKSVNKFATFFMDDMSLKGLTVNDYLSEEDVKNAEMHLNPTKQKKSEERIK